VNTRSYADWQHEARTTTKSVTALGNELRDRWDDWKKDAPYDRWEDCIQGELGISASALRMRNTRQRRNLTATDVAVSKLQPKRQQHQGKPADAAETERRRQHVAQLREAGYSWDPIREAVGISDGTLSEDLAVLGLKGGRPRVPGGPKSHDKPSGDFHWRNEDLGIPNEESTIEVPSYAACDTPSAAEAIEDVRIQLALILGRRYSLSLKDRNNLINVLSNALERARNGKQEETQNPRRATSVAG